MFLKPHLKMSPSILISLLFITLPLIPYPPCIRGEELLYESCQNSFSCGRIKDISYPFWLSDQKHYCGHPAFALNCDKEDLSFSIDSLTYRVNNVSVSTQILNVSRTDLLNTNLCTHEYKSTTSFDLGFFQYTSYDHNITMLYGCNLPPGNGGREMDAGSLLSFSCLGSGDNYVSISQEPLSQELTGKCESVIQVPVIKTSRVVTGDFSLVAMLEALGNGFQLHWIDKNAPGCHDCRNSGGKCGYDSTLEDFTCLCPDGPRPTHCKKSNHNHIGMKIGIGIGAGFVAMMFAVFFMLYVCRRKKYGRSSVISRSMSSIYSSRTDFEKGSFSYGVRIFDYDELARATNNFDPAAELGDGGFGTVFKGKLRDGRVIAVKRLYEHNCKRVEQFMNEVDILARLRHPNLISLYGCTSRQSSRLLLVYEYIPNGTVADHINGELDKPCLLPWLTRLKIAVETATALVYLHASDVIHRDLKTNNILLDENFTVKVADFGLSRLFPLEVTHITTAPQGTPGYVDPEYHQCYQLTEKSDVYSFGVVLIELISSLPAVDIMRHRHEINLSALALNKIQANALHELVDGNLGFQSDENTREMITAVAELAFQCLQPRHDERPSMKEVLKTLKHIRKCGCKDEKADDSEDTSDDVVLLKNNPLLLSPDSVTAKWVSMSSSSTSQNAIV